MIIDIKKYKDSKLNNDLSLDEELVLLVFKEMYLDKPFNLSIAVEPLELSRQHISRMVRGLINRGYMIRVNSIAVDLTSKNVNFIPTNFVFTSDLSIDDKRMIILLYKTFVNKDVINTNELNSSLPKELTMDLIETLMEEGVIMYGMPLDFNDVFNLTSHYDL